MIRADGLDPRHGFFGRGGGVSSGIYDSLNCGPGSLDDPANVATNRARAMAEIGLSAEALVTVHQVHSADVVEVEGPFTGERPKADGLVTRTSGVALGVLSADCAPILFEDRTAGVIGAAHSGWRGTLAGIGGVVVEKMVSLGAERQQISAAIGPTISQRAYEVGPEFVESFLDENASYAEFFADGGGDRAKFDLPSFILSHLRKEGIQVRWTGHCTHSDPERFFSYRRNTQNDLGDYGRLLSIIYN